MEHLQVPLEKNMTKNGNSDVKTPQEVVDAIITLTKAGLLNWRTPDVGSASVEVGFGLFEREDGQSVLNHDFRPDDEESEGFLMTTTKAQRSALLKAITAEAKAAAAGK
jgi:hypothetical protein